MFGGVRSGLMGTPMPSIYGTQGPIAHGGFDELDPNGGMDVLGSLRKHSNFATQFQSNPTGGMGGGMFGTGGMNYGGG